MNLFGCQSLHKNMEDLERINEDKYWHYNSLVSLGSLSLAAWNGSIYRLEEVKLGQQEEALGGWSRVCPDVRMNSTGRPQVPVSAFPKVLLWCFGRLLLCGSMQIGSMTLRPAQNTCYLVPNNIKTIINIQGLNAIVWSQIVCLKILIQKL